MHIMADLETLSLRPSATILQVAMVEFEPVPSGQVKVYEALNLFLDPERQPGRHIDGATLMWWMEQSDEARAVITAGYKHSISLPEALTKMQAWCTGRLGEHGRLWAQGSDFDVAILNDAFSSEYCPTPWAYNQPRDLRTFLECHDALEAITDNAMGRAEKLMAAHGTFVEHDALSDCVLQICRYQEAGA